jgi:predicted RNA-binding protein
LKNSALVTMKIIVKPRNLMVTAKSFLIEENNRRRFIKRCNGRAVYVTRLFLRILDLIPAVHLIRMNRDMSCKKFLLNNFE